MTGVHPIEAKVDIWEDSLKAHRPDSQEEYLSEYGDLLFTDAAEDHWTGAGAGVHRCLNRDRTQYKNLRNTPSRCRHRVSK